MNVYENMGSPKKAENYIKFRESCQSKSELVSSVTPDYQPRASSGGYDPYAVGSDGSKWHGGIDGSGATPVLNHYILRNNARKAYQQHVHAKAVVDRFADTVIGTGLKLQATPQADILGISAEEAEEWARDTEARFHLWAQDKRSMRNESMTFYQAQRLVEIQQQRDGEWFMRLFYSRSPRLQNQLQLGFVDPSQISGSGYTSTATPWLSNDSVYSSAQNGNLPYTTDGIERDVDGREIAYHVYVRNRDGYKITRVPAVGQRSGRRIMLHGWQPEHAGQGRGYSRLAGALQELQNITEFTVAQLKKAIAQSMITMFVEPGKDQDSSDPMGALNQNLGVGPRAPSGDACDAGCGDTPTDEVVRYNTIPEATFNDPGSIAIFNLLKGEKIHPFANSAPTEQYGNFVMSVLSGLSASLSMPVEVVLMKFGQNYSASRGALLLFWNVALIWREEKKADLLDPVFEAWLAGEIAAGRKRAPGWSDPVLRAAWLSNNWIGTPMPNIDPMRTAMADKTYVEIGAQDLDRVARNHNGSDGAANRAKLVRQFEELPKAPWLEKSDNSSAPSKEDVDAAKKDD